MTDIGVGLWPKFTEGPWRFEVNPKFKSVRLCGGTPMYDKTVMDFQRWGMRGATFSLFDRAERMTHPVIHYAVEAPMREHHKDWFQIVKHPDAALIEAAPLLYRQVEKLIRILKGGAESQAEIIKAPAEAENVLAIARGLYQPKPYLR